MSVIKKVQSKVNFLRKSVLLIQLELEKYCLNEINYQFALKLCQACLAPRIGDDVYRMGTLFFGHLLTTYKNYTYHAVQEVLRKRQQQTGYPRNVLPDDLVNNHFGENDFPFFEYMINDALSANNGTDIDNWHFVRDKIEVLLKCQVAEPATEKPLTAKESKKLALLQKMASKYDKAASYLLDNMRYYAQYPVNFKLANQICRATIYSHHYAVRLNALASIGDAADAYQKKPDADLIAELINMHYRPTNIYYQRYVYYADDALRSIEDKPRPPRRREDLQFELEFFGNELKIRNNALEEDGCVWFKLKELIKQDLKKNKLWNQDPSKQIGIILVNQEEASAMGKVVAVLKKLIANVGEKQDNASYLQAPEFAELMQVAGQANQLLLANDEKFKKIYFK